MGKLIQVECGKNIGCSQLAVSKFCVNVKEMVKTEKTYWFTPKDIWIEISEQYILKIENKWVENGVNI